MASLDWIKDIDPTLLKLDKKPQFGGVEQFSFENFEELLRRAFESPQISLTRRVEGWKDKDAVTERFPKDALFHEIFFSPLEEPLFFVTTMQDIKRLMASFFGDDAASSFFYERGLAEGFYTYFASEILFLLERIGFGSPLVPRLGEMQDYFEVKEIIDPCFVIDTSLSHGKDTFAGQIIVPKSFRDGWKKYFAELPEKPLSEEDLAKLPVTAACVVGYVDLTYKEWNSVKKGDFILLDRCTYNPDSKQGSIQITLQGKSIFRARFRDGEVKIANYPEYDEVSTMEDDEDEDEDFDVDLFEDEDLEEDEEEEGDEEEIDEEEIAEEKGAKPKRQEAQLKPEEIPVHLVVEVGRIHMNAKDLLALSPGNVLEMQISPEQGVDLTIQGKKVGKGELLRIGDVLGVRIISF